MVFGRVLGRLAVSRAIGDKSMKPFVSAEPEVTTIPLRAGDEFILLACDGLWDVADNATARQVARFHKRQRGNKAAAIGLTTYAVRTGSVDNVTAMIVDIKAYAAELPALSRGGEDLVWYPKAPEIAAKQDGGSSSSEDEPFGARGAVRRTTSL